MGTILLPPQDCLPSPHNRQNHHFPSSRRPDTGRRYSEAFMVAAEDCARHNYSGGSPPGDGLLPIPKPSGQARGLPRITPFPSKTSAIFCTPPAGRTALASPSKRKISRSTSAILPTPLTASPPRVEGDGLHTFRGWLPFKTVQGNGLGNKKSDVVQCNNSKKLFDARNGAQTKTVGSSVHAHNVKVKDNVDGNQVARSTLKLPRDGADLNGHPKKVSMRKQRTLERSHSVKGTCESYAQQVQVPTVMILQRPKNEEAAAELFAKFFQKSAEQDIVSVSEKRVNPTVENMQNLDEMTLFSEIEQQRNTEGFFDLEALEDKDKSCQTIFSGSSGTDMLGEVVDKYAGGSLQCPAVSSTLLLQSEVGTLSASKNALKEPMPDYHGEELLPWERWAGPSYINSPPPSALPLPRFPRKNLKVESLATAGFFEEIVSDQSPMPPSSISPLHANFSGKLQLGNCSDGVASATNNLKRILNLDL